MSNALAIAAVTAVLKDLLQNAVIDHDLVAAVGEVKISALPPDRVMPSQNGTVDNQLNLFLHRVTANPGWRNVQLPSRDSRGDRLSSPPLALDLHYLLTAYGSQDLSAEVLMGYGMQVLHENPVLPRDAIRKALGPPPPVTGSLLPTAMKTLTAAELAEQVEQIKITPQYLDNQEMSHVWSSLQTPYRTSTGYLVTVLLIESRRAGRSTLPVKDFNVYATPFNQPFIAEVAAAAGAGTPILSGQPILISGQRLRGAITRIQLGTVEVVPTDQELSETRIQATIPSSLHPGVQALQVVHLRPMGTPPQPHRGVESNVSAFVLQPKIQKDTNGNYRITITNPQTSNGLRKADVQVQIEPKAGRDQRIALLLNKIELATDHPAPAYNFLAEPWTDPNKTEDDTFNFKIVGVDPGPYLIRVQVDGADSPLDIINGQYSGPRKMI